MWKRLSLVALVLAVVGMAIYWLGFREQLTDSAEQTEAAGSTVDRAAIVRDKLAARDRGEIDLSPCSALGRVTEANDQTGIAGAVVLLTPKGLSQGVAREPGQPEDPIVVRTDAGGGWEVDRLPPGRYTLSASADAYLPSSRVDLVLQAGQPNSGLDLALAKGGHRLSGVVTDVGGGPVEGVMVAAVKLDDGGPLNFSRAPLATLTNEDGRYQLQLADGDYVLATFHPDYVAAQRMTTIEGGPRTENLELTPSGVIEGVVLTRAENRPVAGAIVTFSNAHNQWGMASGGFSVGGIGDGRVEADENGRFRLRGVGSGVIKVSAVAEGYATREPVEVALGVAEQVSEVEVVVDRAFKISGFVVSKGDETAGLEGVLVGALSLQPPALVVGRGPSEADGFFEILGVQPGSYMVSAIGEETLPNITGTSATVVDQDVSDVLVVMDRGVTVSGRTDPPAEASISIALNTDEFSFSTFIGQIGNALCRTRADQDGDFMLGPVSPGKLRVVAVAPDGRKGETEVEVGAEGLEGVVIRLDPRASVSGTVTDASGAAVAGVTVTLEPETKSSMVLQFNGRNAFGSSATTADDGSYAVRGLDSGRYHLLVRDRKQRALEWAEPEDPSKPAMPMELEVADRDEMTGMDLVVEARNGVIRGTVMGPDGAPLADAWVSAAEEMSRDEFLAGFTGQRRERDDQVRAQTRPEQADDEAKPPELAGFFREGPVLTDQSGAFELTNLRRATYRVTAEGLKGSARAHQDGVEVGDRVILRVEELAGIRGRVTDAGKAVREYTVEVEGPVTREKTVRSDDGSFVIDRLDPGSYAVRVRADVGVAEASTEVEGAKISEVRLEIEGWGKLSGIVVDSKTGDPIAGMMVMAHSGRDRMDVGAGLSMLMGQGPRTDGSGRFEVSKVEPGTGTLRVVDPSGVGVASRDYEIEADQDLDLGTIQGVAASRIPADQRGDLGLSLTVATFDRRPLAPEAEPDDEPETGATDERLWVASVTVGGPAAEAGVNPGDEVVSIGGTRVTSIGADTARTLTSSRNVKVGDDVRLEIERDGSRQTVTVTAIAKQDG